MGKWGTLPEKKDDAAPVVDSKIVYFDQLISMRQADIKFPFYAQFRASGFETKTHKRGMYLVLNKCGSGGFSTVYRAVLLDHAVVQIQGGHMITEYSDLRTHQHLVVAIKLVHRSTTMDEVNVMQSFHGIYGVCSILEHGRFHQLQGILNEYQQPMVRQGLNDKMYRAKVKPVRVEDPSDVISYYMVLPYIQAITLGRVHADPALLIRYTYRLLLSLSCLQQVGLMHRDLKPSNFLMDDEEHHLLIDFGLARFFDVNTAACPECAGNQYSHERLCPLRSHLPSYVRQSKKDQTTFHMPDLFELRTMGAKRTAAQKLSLQARGYPATWDRTCRWTEVLQCERLFAGGTRGFICPEDHCMWPYLCIQADVWSAGCMLLGVMLNQQTSFVQSDNHQALMELAVVVGMASVEDAMRSMHVSSPAFPGSLLKETKYTADLDASCGSIRAYLHTHGVDSSVYHPDLLQLVCMMLEPNPFRRITAAQGLRCPLFKDIVTK